VDRILQLSKRHDRDGFDCGIGALNEFLRRTARQHIEKGLSVTSVLVSDSQPDRILGYYTLVFVEVEPAQLPSLVAKPLPAHRVPAIKLARLAVATSEQGKGVGAALLAEAMRDAVSATNRAGGIALFVDAKDDRAAAFYRRYGFTPLPDLPLQLMMPIKQVAQFVEMLPHA
jgi:GNAT superfamily N-acetyltransferase